MIKINQWLGYNEDASQYLLRPGELRVLNNLQPRRPGMLLSRSGLKKIYGKYDNDSIFGIYRRATVLGSNNDYLWFQKIKVDKLLTIEEIEQNLPDFELQWVVRRVIGNESRVIDTMEERPDGVNELHNFSIAEDRRGRLFIIYGHGVKPRLYLPQSLTNSAIEMGMPTPTVAPVVTPSGRGRFIESVNVRFAGGSYYDAPEVTILGDCDRQAQLTPIIRFGKVTGVEVTDGGAGYKDAPKITCTVNPQGSGFRALGNFSSSAKEIIGFDTTVNGTFLAPGTFSGPDDDETFGTKDAGTTDQSIVLSGHEREEVGPYIIKGVAGTATPDGGSSITLITLQLETVGDIHVADAVDIFPKLDVVAQDITNVQSIDEEQNQITLSVNVFDGGTTLAGVIVPDEHTITFKRNTQREFPLTYNDRTKQYSVTVPTTYEPKASNAVTQEGTIAGGGTSHTNTQDTDDALKTALATLRFSPKSYGFAVNTAAPWDSIETTVSNWQTYGGGKPFLYNEFWEGSDFNRKGSAGNARYGGLQASGKQFVRGFIGSVGGRSAEVYWPDYSEISVWVCTGTYSAGLGQWTRLSIPVETETTTTSAGDTASSKFIRFRVPATSRARTARSINKDLVASEYEGWDGLPDAEGPLVKLYLTECPDSWISDSTDQCLPTQAKENKPNRLEWWVSGTNVTRPLVNIVPEGGEIDANTLVIEDPGKGWAKNALFAMRLYQGNAYEQRVDYNTAAEQTSIPGAASRSGGYVEFRLRANAPDAASTPDGPPHVLLSPTHISSFDDGWSSGQSARLLLLKRKRETQEYGIAHWMEWTAKVLATLESSAGRLTSVSILTRGNNYFSEPELTISGGNGFGAKVSPVLQNGQIVRCTIEDPGLSYTDRPEITTDSRPAKLSAVMRPTMKGRYRCAYRFVDRAETLVKTFTATKGNSSNIILTDDPEGIEKDMILEGEHIPWNARVTSVSDNEITLDRDVDTLSEGHDLLWQSNEKTGEFTEALTLLGANAGSKIYVGEVYFSPNKEYRLEFTSVGNLELRRKKRITLSSGIVVEQYSEFVYDSGTAREITGRNYIPYRPFIQFNENGQLEVKDEILDVNGGVVEVQHFGYLNTTAATNPTLELTNGGFLGVYTEIPSTSVQLRDMTQPISYSDFSPIVDLNAGPNEERPFCSEIEWKVPGIEIPSRADLVEFWRTSSAQSLVYYRAEVYGVPAEEGVEVVGKDTLSDEELFDTDRPFYQAMPVVLPNGNVNAYRFGQPRSDMSCVASFQDRLFMGVSTSGEKPNTIFYSEYDEFESFPDVNELPIQLNQKNTDTLTALVPFGSMLLLMQHTHTYSLAYNTDPAVDASIQMMSHRGTLHNRTWDIHENILYSADESGIYAMSRAGEVSEISLPLRDFFVSELIDFAKREKFFLQIDPRTHILRLFCCLKTNPSETPTQALCFDIQAKTWWTESYPNSITSSCSGRPSDTRTNTILLGAIDGNMYDLDGHEDHSNHSLTDTIVQNAGKGYIKPPNITVPNCKGAHVQAVVTEGRLVDVVIQDAGYDADYGIDILSEDGKILKGHDDKLVQGVEYAGIKMIIDPPEPGGTQAVARANFSVLPVIRRLVNVSKGESFVRILPTPVPQIEPLKNDYLATESGADLVSESGKQLETVTPACEIGMEAIGEFIPLNAFVSRIEADNVHLEHPDGTPALILHGAERTNLYPTDESRLELGGTEMMIEFRKPATTNVPFRMVTGAMAIANEENTRAGDRLMDKSITLVYTPTDNSKEVEILERFNGRDELRANSARNSRHGAGGWRHREDSGSTVLDLSDTASHLGLSTGVAKATFASRTTTDMGGTDRHLQIELHGNPTRTSKFSRTNFWVKEDNPDAQQFVMHSMSVNGVTADG